MAGPAFSAPRLFRAVNTREMVAPDLLMAAVAVLVLLIVAFVIGRRTAKCPPKDNCPLENLCPPCPAGKECPPEKLCPPCPDCPSCPSGGLCPSCPDCPSCPSGGLCPSCPSCPTCPAGGLCPPCPAGGLCPTCEPCTRTPEMYVFNVGNGVPASSIPQIEKALNARVATLDQATSAYYAGADWCKFGWVNVGSAAAPTYRPYVAHHTPSAQCYTGVPGLTPSHGTLAAAAVVLYGVKPPASTTPACTANGTGMCLLPWNDGKWSRWD